MPVCKDSPGLARETKSGTRPLILGDHLVTFTSSICMGTTDWFIACRERCECKMWRKTGVFCWCTRRQEQASWPMYRGQAASANWDGLTGRYAVVYLTMESGSCSMS